MLALLTPAACSPCRITSTCLCWMWWHTVSSWVVMCQFILTQPINILSFVLWIKILPNCAGSDIIFVPLPTLLACIQVLVQQVSELRLGCDTQPALCINKMLIFSLTSCHFWCQAARVTTFNRLEKLSCTSHTERTRTFFSFMSLCRRPWLCRKRIPSTTSRAIWSLSLSDKPAW